MKTKEIAELLGGQLVGDGNLEISGVADLEKAGTGEIAFLEKAELTERARASGASCLIVPDAFNEQLPFSAIRVKNPKLAFAQIAARLHPAPRRRPGISPSAHLAASASASASDAFIAEMVTIGENSVIGDGTEVLAGTRIGANVTIGQNCVIHPNCVIYDNVTIGSNVILHAGVVIGADGFGYVRDGAAGYVKFPQLGTVVIEDNVEIGAHTCVDRGALGETRIGEGTKIDNLVQIGHNVQVGRRVVIAAQTGISGSTVIEDDCVIGGQVGMGDHARVLSGAVIGSQAGVLPGKIVRPGVWWGTPVQPLDEYKRQNAMIKGLARLREEIRELKRKLTEE